MEKINKSVSINITTGTILKGIAIFLLVWFLFAIRDLVLVLLASVVIASAIEPGARWMIKRRVPRTIAVLFIYMVVILVFVVIFYLFVPILIADVNDILNQLPDYLQTISSSTMNFQNYPAIQGLITNISENTSGQIIGQIADSFSVATFSFLSTASFVFGGILSFFLIIVLSFYFAVQEDGVTNFLRIVTPIQHEQYVVDLWKRSQRKIGLWMQGQLVLGLLIGVLTFLSLSIIGLENAFVLAIIAAVFELIPVFGPILASIPAIMFGLIDGGITFGFLIAGIYLIIQQFESQLIHPLVVKKIVGIPSIIVIIVLIIGIQLAGFLGIILSIPVAAAVMEYVGDVRKKKTAELKNLKN